MRSCSSVLFQACHLRRVIVWGAFVAVVVALLGGCDQMLFSSRADDDPMTQAKMERVLQQEADQFEGQPGLVRFVFAGVPMACVSDPPHDRMRIIAPIMDEDKLTDKQRRAMLEANFHTTLDARYATSHGVVYAAFIHPLSSLSVADLRAAVRQVASLVKNFGTTYSSDQLQFGQPDDDPPEDETRRPPGQS